MRHLAVLALLVAVPWAAHGEVTRLTEATATGLLRGWSAEVAARDQARRDHAAAEGAYREAVAAHPAKVRAYQEQKARWDACRRAEVDPAMARGEKNVNAAVGDRDAAQARAQAVAAKMKAAAAAGDLGEVQRLAKELSDANRPVMAATQEAQAELTAASQKCGAQPGEPRAPSAPAQVSARNYDVGSRAAGISASGYRQLEERILWALTSDGGVDLSPKMGWMNSEIAPFTPAEVTVLKARGKALVQGHRAVASE